MNKLEFHLILILNKIIHYNFGDLSRRKLILNGYC
jgi:hypothetical protein